MQSKIKKAVIINICIMLVVLGINVKTSLLINKSDSITGKIFLLVYSKNFIKGDLVGIKDFVTVYTANRHFTKKVAGFPGDKITLKGKGVYINGELQAIVKNKTKDGMPLTPIKAQVIPKDKYFVVTAHKDSFDSRYREFSLVGAENIEGKAYRIW